MSRVMPSAATMKPSTDKKHPTASPERAPLIGFINVDKPAGWTSHDVVAKVRGLLRTPSDPACPAGRSPKVGHVGTLDPMATGILPLCIGKATKVSRYLMAEQKQYQAVMKLGERTDTQDATGIVVSSVPVPALDREQIEAVCREFVGSIEQLPPMFSAVKIGGAPLYKAARLGRVVERTTRRVEIASLRVLAVEGPLVTIDVECSKGTYIRTLCADIGDRLGVGAHVCQLQRRRVGSFTLEQAATLEQVEAAIRSGAIESLLTPIDRALEHLPLVLVDEATAGRVRHGVAVPASAARTTAALTIGREVRIQAGQGDVLAIGVVTPDAAGWKIRIDTVLAEAERLPA